MTESDEVKFADAFREEVLAYLRRRPSAADDVAGIAYWWLYHQRYVRHLHVLEAVLADLASAHWLERSPGGAGPVVYSAGPRLRAEMGRPDDGGSA